MDKNYINLKKNMKILFADWYASNMPLQFFYMGLSWVIGFGLIWAYCKRKNDDRLKNTYAAQEKIYSLENYLGLTFIVLLLLKKPMTIPAIIVLILFIVLTVIFVVRTTKFMIDLVSGKFDE